jgi:ABC-type sugar transport system permease subunit
MLSLALIGIIWEFFYSPNYGLINTITGHNANANLIDWLGNPSLNLWSVLVEASWRQAGYVMVLYLAGLKAVDPNLQEAARIDGASAWQTFWHVTFPSMMPMNVVVAVITVIESLRAFDLVYITNKGTNGLELLSALITSNIVGETSRIGFGSALGVVLLVISLVPISAFLYQMFVRREAR